LTKRIGDETQRIRGQEYQKEDRRTERKGNIVEQVMKAINENSKQLQVDLAGQRTNLTVGHIDRRSDQETSRSRAPQETKITNKNNARREISPVVGKDRKSEISLSKRINDHHIPRNLDELVEVLSDYHGLTASWINTHIRIRLSRSKYFLNRLVNYLISFEMGDLWREKTIPRRYQHRGHGPASVLGYPSVNLPLQADHLHGDNQ